MDKLANVCCAGNNSFTEMSEKLPGKLRKISKIGNEIQERGRENIEGPHELAHVKHDSA